MEHAVHKSEILQDMHKDLFPLYFYHFFLIVERRRCSSNSHMENYLTEIYAQVWHVCNMHRYHDTTQSQISDENACSTPEGFLFIYLFHII